MFLKHFLFLILIVVCAAHNGRGRGSGKNCQKPSGSQKPSSSQKTSSTTVVRTEVQRPVINIDSSLMERPLSLFGSLLEKLVKPCNDKKETQNSNQIPNTNRNNNRNQNTRNDVVDYPDSNEDIPPQTVNRPNNSKPTKEEVVERVREHVARDREIIENKKETLDNNRNNPRSVPEKKQLDDDVIKKAHWYRPFTEDDNYDLYDYNEIDDRFK